MSEVKETMEDFASELEASYKEYDARRNNAYQDQEGPDAEKWAELAQQMEDKTVLKVKVKEAVKGGLVAYVDDIQGFIPASQAADHYIEKLEDLVGQHLEVVPITVDMEKKRLVLSARAVLQEKKAAERAEKLAAVEVRKSGKWFKRTPACIPDQQSAYQASGRCIKRGPERDGKGHRRQRR